MAFGFRIKIFEDLAPFHVTRMIVTQIKKRRCTNLGAHLRFLLNIILSFGTTALTHLRLHIPTPEMQTKHKTTTDAPGADSPFL